MKCDECGFQHCVAKESYIEYYCELFGEDVPKEFATYDGCNLMFNEAKKLSELLNDNMRTYKEHDLADKKYNNYYDILLSRRKKK